MKDRVAMKTRSPIRAGVGLRLPHLADIVATRPPASWFEIHPETFLANAHAIELLMEVAEHYPISIHTVGVSVGSADGINRQHLARVAALIDRIDPVLVSGHLAWSTHEGEYLNDLLPLPYDEETLRLVASHVDEVQGALGRRYLIENPSSYLGFSGSRMTEVEFLSELVSRTGCQLLCDVSNVHLSAHNLGFDPREYIDGFPADAVAELHLGGFTVEVENEHMQTVLIDTHGDRIAEPAWALYAYAVRRFGPKPTLIERDNDIPTLAALLAEATLADTVATDDLTRKFAYARAG
jgi:uncharacterized protein